MITYILLFQYWKYFWLNDSQNVLSLKCIILVLVKLLKCTQKNKSDTFMMAYKLRTSPVLWLWYLYWKKYVFLKKNWEKPFSLIGSKPNSINGSKVNDNFFHQLICICFEDAVWKINLNWRCLPTTTVGGKIS